MLPALDLKLAAEPVGHRRQEFERGRQELFDARAPIQIEDGVIADQEDPKRQRDIDAEIAAASAATRPEAIRRFPWRCREPFAEAMTISVSISPVACEPVQPLAEAEAATEREAGDADTLAAAMRRSRGFRFAGRRRTLALRAPPPKRRIPSSSSLPTSFIRRDVYEETVSGRKACVRCPPERIAIGTSLRFAQRSRCRHRRAKSSARSRRHDRGEAQIPGRGDAGEVRRIGLQELAAKERARPRQSGGGDAVTTGISARASPRNWLAPSAAPAALLSSCLRVNAKDSLSPPVSARRSRGMIASLSIISDWRVIRNQPNS